VAESATSFDERSEEAGIERASTKRKDEIVMLRLVTLLLLLFGVHPAVFPAFGQANFGAVLFNPVFANEFRPPAGQNEGESFPVDRFGPGLEYRTNPRGRISWGIGYQRQNVPLQTITDEELFTDDQGNLLLHFIYEDQFDATVDVISATAYINILTRKVVQPFIGIGGGVGIGKGDGTSTFTDVLNDVVEQSPISEKTYDLVLRGVAGASVFPHEHVILTGGGGYQNGGVGFFQVGFVF